MSTGFSNHYKVSPRIGRLGSFSEQSSWVVGSSDCSRYPMIEKLSMHHCSGQQPNTGRQSPQLSFKNVWKVFFNKDRIEASIKS